MVCLLLQTELPLRTATHLMICTEVIAFFFLSFAFNDLNTMPTNTTDGAPSSPLPLDEILRAIPLQLISDIYDRAGADAISAFIHGWCTPGNGPSSNLFRQHLLRPHLRKDSRFFRSHDTVILPQTEGYDEAVRSSRSLSDPTSPESSRYVVDSLKPAQSWHRCFLFAMPATTRRQSSNSLVINDSFFFGSSER